MKKVYKISKGAYNFLIYKNKRVMNMEQEIGFGGKYMVERVEDCIDNIIVKSRDSEWFEEYKYGIGSGTLKALVKHFIFNHLFNQAALYGAEYNHYQATDDEWAEYIDMVFDGCEDVEPMVIDRERKLAELID